MVFAVPVNASLGEHPARGRAGGLWSGMDGATLGFYKVVWPTG